MQTRIDSMMEAVTNTAIGFIISLITWQLVATMFGIPMPLSENLQITAIFTVVSVIRQYILRRSFDGRTPWQALRKALNV